MHADLHKLRSLLEVIDRGGFSGAAVTLGVAQSALSRHVAELERAYGQRLLRRTGRGAVPTPLTEEFLPRMRLLVRDADHLYRDITIACGKTVGRVRIGLIQSVGSFIITPLLNEIADHYPGLDISIREGLTDHIYEWLAAGDVEIGIAYVGHSDRRDADALMLVDYYLVGSPNDPRLARPSCTMEEAANLAVVLPDANKRWRSAIAHAFAARGHRLQIAIETDSVQAIMDLARVPGRYTIAPMHLALPYLRTGALAATKIVEPAVTRRLDLMTRTSKPSTLGVKVVADILRRQVRAQVRAGEFPGGRRVDAVD